MTVAALRLVAQSRSCIECERELPIDEFPVYRCNGKFGGGTRREGRRRRCRDCYLRVRRDRGYKRDEWARGKQDPRYHILRQSKVAAYRARVPWSLTAEDIFVPEHCPILGIKLREPGSAGAGRAEDSPTLDRLVPELGYVTGNVSVISFRANRLKNDGTAAEHDRIAAWMRAQGAR